MKNGIRARTMKSGYFSGRDRRDAGAAHVRVLARFEQDHLRGLEADDALAARVELLHVRPRKGAAGGARQLGSAQPKPAHHVASSGVGKRLGAEGDGAVQLQRKDVGPRSVQQPAHSFGLAALHLAVAPHPAPPTAVPAGDVRVWKAATQHATQLHFIVLQTPNECAERPSRRTGSYVPLVLPVIFCPCPQIQNLPSLDGNDTAPRTLVFGCKLELEVYRRRLS